MSNIDILTPENLYSVHDSKFVEYVLIPGLQTWSFTNKRINIVEKGGIIKSFNKSAIRFITVNGECILSPFINNN